MSVEAPQTPVSAARAGGRVLLVLSDPLNASILRLLARGPLPVPELPNHLGSASRTTRFNRLRELEELGIIVREKEGGSPPLTYCGLSEAGRELLPVVRTLHRWLWQKPGGAHGRGDLFGALETKALAAGWNSTALRWLAERPCSLTELDAQSPPEVSYHDARRAREELSDTGLIAPVPSEDRGQPYALTDWARRAASSLAAAIRWERDFLDEDAAIPTAVEAEALLLLAIPSSDSLHRAIDGACFLRLDGLAGVSVTVEEGRIASCTPGPSGGGESLVGGTLEAWLGALSRGITDGLRMSGGIRLTTAIAKLIQKAHGHDL